MQVILRRQMETKSHFLDQKHGGNGAFIEVCRQHNVKHSLLEVTFEARKSLMNHILQLVATSYPGKRGGP